MAATNHQYCAQAQGKPLVAISTSKPSVVEPSEVLIRLKAIAINPADYKMIDLGHRVTSWPFVPGMDGAGVVEAIGHDVKRFAVGDEVLAMFVPTSRTGGSYQCFALAHEILVAHKPKSWSFEQAATLPVCYLTAVTALGIGLRAPLPFIKEGPLSGFCPSSVLVLGGSSALGAATIQLLRIALPDCLILATSSPKHHGHLTNDLNADKAFDRHSASLIANVKSGTPGGRGVDAIVDTVGVGRTERQIFEAFDPTGPRKYAQVWTGDEEIEAPDGVESTMFRARDLFQLEGHKNAMPALQALLDGDKYRLPVSVHKVGDGLEALAKGLDLMRNGLSGEKLVVSISS